MAIQYCMHIQVHVKIIWLDVYVIAQFKWHIVCPVCVTNISEFWEYPTHIRQPLKCLSAS